jgi:hypothetical protein
MIFYNFSKFCNIYVFIEKEKKKRKEKKKGLHGLGPTHNEASPTARIQPRLEKKHNRRSPFGSRHFALGTLIYFKNY